MKGFVFASGLPRVPAGSQGHDIDHAGVMPRRLDVEESHATARDLADRHHGMQHSGGWLSAA